REVTQDEVRRVLSARRAADAEPDPIELARAERRAQRLESVMAVVAATEPDSHAARLEVELVVDHNDSVERGLEELGEAGSGGARLVHEHARLGQHAASAVDAGLGDV